MRHHGFFRRRHAHLWEDLVLPLLRSGQPGQPGKARREREEAQP